jgi:hypothetical protein
MVMAVGMSVAIRALLVEFLEFMFASLSHRSFKVRRFQVL